MLAQGLTGIAVTWDELCLRTVDGKRFYMRLSSGSLVTADDAPLLIDHDPTDEVEGAKLAFSDDPDALRFYVSLPDSASGRRVLEAVRAGELRGVSVGLKFDRFGDAEECDGDLIVSVRKACVQELSLVREPALRNSRFEIASRESVELDRRLAAGRGLRWASSRLTARW